MPKNWDLYLATSGDHELGLAGIAYGGLFQAVTV